MKQQQLNFTGHEVIVGTASRPWAHVTTTVIVKEEPLTHYAQQGPTCAYYALATLKGLSPNDVIAVGKAVVKESRLRKFCGKHDIIIETYRRLGYRFPWREMSWDETHKTKSLPLDYLVGSGLLRLTPRRKSNWGHVVAYKAGLVYDGNKPTPMEAEGYFLSLSKNYYYVRVIPEICLSRGSEEVTGRERRAQDYLKKRPRRTRRKRIWNAW